MKRKPVASATPSALQREWVAALASLATRSATIVLTAMLMGAACADGEPTPQPHPGDCTETVIWLAAERRLIVYESGYFEYDGTWGYIVGDDLTRVPDDALTNAYFHSKTFY